MCRDIEHGGRRCPQTPSSVANRRARQRRYMARKREKAKALKAAEQQAAAEFTARFAEAQTLAPINTPLFGQALLPVIDPQALDRVRDFRPGPFGPKRQTAAFAASETIDEMRRQGRFDILDAELDDAQRERIAALSEAELTAELDALRDHLCVDTLVSGVDMHNETALAEKASRRIGDVALTWVNAQLREQRDAALETRSRSAQEIVSAEARRAELIRERGQMARFTSDAASEWYSEYDAAGARLTQAESALSAQASEFVAERARALSTLVDALVGSSAEVGAGKFTGAGIRANRAALTDAAARYPDSWKAASDAMEPMTVLGIGPRGRASYSHRAAVKGQTWATWLPPIADDEPGDVPEPRQVTSYLRHRYPTWDTVSSGSRIDALIGGDPDNPDHVAASVAEAARLTAADEQYRTSHPSARWMRKLHWESTVVDGRLTVVQKLDAGKGVVGYEPRMRVNPHDPSDTTHELGHRMEIANPHLAKVCREFVRRRARDANGDMPRPIRYHRDKQDVYPDNFVNAYVGKLYDDGPHTEVLTTGMEALFHGRFGGGEGLGVATGKYARSDDSRMLAADRDHLNMVLGLLLTAPKLNSSEQKGENR